MRSMHCDRGDFLQRHEMASPSTRSRKSTLILVSQPLYLLSMTIFRPVDPYPCSVDRRLRSSGELNRGTPTKQGKRQWQEWSSYKQLFKRMGRQTFSRSLNH